MDTKLAFDKILYQGHPSFGTARAVFLFALGEGPTRLLMVEANNVSAVLCLERILLTDGKVSDNCRILSVIRDHRNVGSRSDELTVEIPFVDFCTDIVDPDRILEDATTLTCFKSALTLAEQEYAQMKFMSAADEEQELFEELDADSSGPFVIQVPKALPPKSPAHPENRQQLSLALVGLGFSKSEVRKFIEGLGDRVETEELQALLREGLQSLAA